MSSRARHLAHRLDVIVLHRLLEPPVAELLQRAADADRAADRVAVIGVERERELVADQLAHRARLGDVAGNVAIQPRARSLSKRILIAAGLSFSRASTTRSTSSTLRSPLPPIEA